MARSLIGDFVRAARSLLAVQVFIAVGAVALAGWTLAVTNQALRERDLLRERVIQLEAAMAERGIVVPPTQTVSTPASDAQALYPGSIGADAALEADTGPDLRQTLSDVFSPAPPLRTVVLHVRAETDSAAAQTIARDLAGDARDVIVRTMPVSDPRPSGYVYFDGRQNRAAAELMTQFHDSARRNGVAPWSAQLRGQALPAQGEYRADRLDIVLPPLPPPLTPATETTATGGGR